MNRIQTKALVEGAIFAGVTAVIGILYYYMQYLGILAMVWPVPVIIVGYRNGLKASILSAMSAGLIVSLLTHPLVGVGLLVGFGLPGILMGYMINKKVNPHIVVILCGLLLSFTIVGEQILAAKAAGIDIFEVITKIDITFKERLEAAFSIYRQQGMAEADIKRISDFFISLWENMKLIFPSSMVMTGMMFSFIDYKLTRLILKRIGHIIPNIEEFSKWRLKEPYSFILLALAVLAGAAQYFKIESLNIFAINISYIFTMFFSIIGISVVVYYSRIYGDRHGIPKALRNTIVLFIVLALIQFLAFVGILDLALNFRKLESKDLGGVR